MKKVMVPIDFSETSLCALKTGIAIANKLSADLRIVYVRPSSSFASGYDCAEEGSVNVVDMLDKLVRDNAQAYYVERGTMDYKIREGNVPTEIVNQAKYDDATMIVMGSHGVSGITQSWIGGNAYRVICNAPCPILVIRPDMIYDSNIRRIAIPIEISKNSRYAVPPAAGMCKLFGAEAVVIGVQSTGIRAIFNRITMSVRQVEKYLRGRAGVEVADSLYISGKDVQVKLAETLAKEKADMVVLSVLNTGSFLIDRFRPLLTTIVNTSHCPVLVIPTKE